MTFFYISCLSTLRLLIPYFDKSLIVNTNYIFKEFKIIFVMDDESNATAKRPPEYQNTFISVKQKQKQQTTKN